MTVEGAMATRSRRRRHSTHLNRFSRELNDAIRYHSSANTRLEDQNRQLMVRGRMSPLASRANVRSTGSQTLTPRAQQNTFHTRYGIAENDGENA